MNGMKRPEILEAARSCVCGDREQDYGTPERSFSAIANFWNAYLKSRGADITLEAWDVAAMMVVFKIARVVSGTYKADSWIDAAGYCACGGELDADARG